MLNTIKTEFSFIQVWFTDQISKALVIIKMRYSIETKFRKYVKGYGFLSFVKKF